MNLTEVSHGTAYILNDTDFIMKLAYSTTLSAKLNSSAQSQMGIIYLKKNKLR
jgi:hypothetical protein